MANLGRISTATFFNNMTAQTLSQQASLYNTQRQMATGKRINDPSDDPIGAAQASVIKDQIAQNASFQTSIGAAQNALQGASSAASQALGQLQNAMQLAVQARNGSYGPTDLKNIGSTLSGILSSMVQTANSQDGSGNYLFSGSQPQTQPFQFNGAGYAYSGDQTVAFARTAPATLTQTSWTGLALFAGAFGGDGVVDAKASSSNSGSGVVSKVVQSSPGSYAGAQYTVSFAPGASGGLEATVTDASSATVYGPAAFKSGQSLSFAGVNLTLDGDPAAGDQFTVGKAQRVNVLDALASLADTLSNAGSLSKSQVQNGLARGQADLAAALSNMTTETALMGSELTNLSTQQSATEDRAVSLETSRSGLEDVDLAKAINDFTAQKTALTASLQSFASISSLSLFNYLR